jgi:hypothetical protein
MKEFKIMDGPTVYIASKKSIHVVSKFAKDSFQIRAIPSNGKTLFCGPICEDVHALYLIQKSSDNKLLFICLNSNYEDTNLEALDELKLPKEHTCGGLPEKTLSIPDCYIDVCTCLTFVKESKNLNDYVSVYIGTSEKELIKLRNGKPINTVKLQDVPSEM